MTLSIGFRSPAPATTGNSRVVRAQLSLVSDSLSRPASTLSLNAWLCGMQLVRAGTPTPDLATVKTNDVGGIDVSMRLPEAFAPGDRVTVRVQANDVTSSSPIDESWEFTVVDDFGPSLSTLCSPGPWTTSSSLPSTVVVAVDRAVARLPEFQISGANVAYQWPGNPQLTNLIAFTRAGANAERSFRGLAGRVFRVVSGGQMREIVSVIGETVDPLTGVVTEIAVYDGSQLPQTSTSVDVMRDLGFDVFVSGTQVVRKGEPVAWSAVVTQSGSALVVSVTPPPGAVSDGVRVPVFVRACDEFARPSQLQYYFDIGLRDGPLVGEISPSPLTRNVSPSATVSFRLTSQSGIDASSVVLRVDGQIAYQGGVFDPLFAGSQVVVVDAENVDFQITRSSDYEDGRIVHFDAIASDLQGRVGERRVWSLQFGSSTGSQSHLAASTVTRVCSFDLTETSFSRPVDLAHNGFAYDGYWYANGVRDSGRRASWFTSLGEFPVAGHVVATPESGWSLFAADGVFAASPWLSATPSASGWSAAGSTSSPLTDADFDYRTPRLAICSPGWGVVVVDFLADRVYRYTGVGRETGSLGPGNGSSSQAGSSPDTRFRVPTASGAVRRLAVDSSGSLVLAQDLALTLITSTALVSRPSSGGPCARLRVSDGLLAAAYNSDGQGRVEVWNLSDFTSFFELYDDMSNPPLPAGEVVDIDFRGPALFVTTDQELAVVDRHEGSSISASAVEIDIVGSISCLSASRDTVSAERGYVYVGSRDPGRIVRWRRHWPAAGARAVVVGDGVDVSSLSAFGRIFDASDVFMRTAMNVGDYVEEPKTATLTAMSSMAVALDLQTNFSRESTLPSTSSMAVTIEFGNVVSGEALLSATSSMSTGIS